MPTYAGPDGVRVPLGACAAVQGGKVWIVGCGSLQAKAYQAKVKAAAAAIARRVARRHSLLRWIEGAVALLVGFSIALLLYIRLQRRRLKKQQDADSCGVPADEQHCSSQAEV